MIIKVFNQGSCDGSRHISYLLSEESHEGYRPEVIFGDAAITKAAVQATKTKHRYTAGVISFKQGEDLTELQQQQLIADFKTAFAPFDDPDRYCEVIEECATDPTVTEPTQQNMLIKKMINSHFLNEELHKTLATKEMHQPVAKRASAKI